MAHSDSIRSKKIEPIPDLVSVCPEVIEAATKGELVLFLGAGLSMALKCPSWQDLATKIVEHIFSAGGITFKDRENLLLEQDPRKLLSICVQIIKSGGAAQPDWEEIFPSHVEENIYDGLLKFRAALVTTNYDLNVDFALERYARKMNRNAYRDEPQPALGELREVKRQHLSFHHLEDLTISRLVPGRVMHLHGCITDPANMVVTTGDYLKAYAPNRDDPRRQPLRREFLDRVFASRTVLFMGYGLGELEILEYIFSPTPGRDARHFMLFPTYNDSYNLVSYYANYYRELGVNLIPFSKDLIGPDQIGDIIKDWGAIVGMKAAPLPTVAGLEAIDSVNP